MKGLRNAYDHDFNGLLKLSDHTAMLWNEPDIIEYRDDILEAIGDNTDPEYCAYQTARICLKMAKKPIRILITGFINGTPAGWIVDAANCFRAHPYPVSMVEHGEGKFKVFSEGSSCLITPPKVKQG